MVDTVRMGFMVVKRTSLDDPAPSSLDRIRQAGLRPTRQRVALAALLFDGTNRHVTAEALHAEAQAAGVRVSLATIYNTLHQFTEVDLLRQVVVDGARTYFDTNVEDHHHFYFEDEGALADIPGHSIVVSGLPEMPPGTRQARVEVVVRVKGRRQS